MPAARNQDSDDALTVEVLTVDGDPQNPLVSGRKNSVRDYIHAGRSLWYRWWKPIVAALVAAVICIVLQALLTLSMRLLFAAEWEKISSLLTADNTLAHPVALVQSVLAIGLLIPALAVGVCLIERRKFGTLSSVKGHLRRDLLGSAFVLAAAIYLPYFLWKLLTQGVSVDLGAIWPQLVIILLLVPFQSAAEEYVTRGWVLQTIGSWTGRAWLTLVISTAAFVFPHVQYGPKGLATVAMTGLCMGWLTLRTGGLEAAIAIHVVNNVLVFGGDLLLQRGPISESGLTFAVLLIGVMQVLLFTALADWWLRRKIVEREGPEVMVGAFGGPVGDSGELSATVARDNRAAVDAGDNVPALSTGETHYEHGPRTFE